MDDAQLTFLNDMSEYDKAYAEEDLLVKVTEQIAEILFDSGLRQSDLAAALGVSEARVSQMMSGEANPTLKTLARVGLALNCTVSLDFVERKSSDEFTWTPVPVRVEVDAGSVLEIAA